MATKTDTLIIGGGVIGVCVAYFLAEAGRSVTLRRPWVNTPSPCPAPAC